MNLGLTDRVVLITGAAQGIGEGISWAFAEEKARIAVVDIQADRVADLVGALQNRGHEALGFTVDISDRKKVEKTVSAVTDAFGRLDILVNNAGILRRAYVEQIKQSDWDAVIAVNLKGVLNCCQAVIGVMRQRRWGKIINSASIIASIPDIGLAAYAVSKSGVVTLTKVLAAELAPYNINVNAYMPGIVETPMTRELIEQRGTEKLRTIALRRFASPRDIANLVLFLSSDVSSYITGAIIDITGGNMLVQRPWLSHEKISEEENQP
jgi:3-oxoacyl-[acyl-carrier protein] reductase